MSARRRVERATLKVDASSDWIKPECFEGEALEKLRLYLDCFVARSEAIGVTKLTSGFIDDLRVDRTQRVNSLMSQMRLKTDIDMKTFKSTGDLAQWLNSIDRDDNTFFEAGGEFAYYLTVSSSAASKRVKRLSEFAHKAAKTSRQIKPNRTQFYRLDSLFRNLRNAFAHGQVKRFIMNGEAYWALQDSNSRQSITSRMCLSETSLDNIVSLIDKRRKSRKR